MASGGVPLTTNKRSKILSTEPSSSSEKVPVKCSVTGNGKVANGNMMTNHDSSPSRKDNRTLNSGGKHASSGLHSPSNNRRTSSSYDTLHVDVDLANRRFSNVSPGRRCLSDSKLTVAKKAKNIPASSIHKRKIEFSSAASPSKRKRWEGTSSSSSPTSPSPRRDSASKHVDYNQNFKEVGECTTGDRTTCSTRPEEYKTEHSIGHRKASAQIATLSEAMLTSPRKLVTTPQVQTKTVTLLSEDREHKCAWEAKKKVTGPGSLPEIISSVKKSKEMVKTPSTPDSLSEDISDKFLKVDNDILFKKESAIDIVVTDCDTEPQHVQVPYQDVFVDSNLSESGNEAGDKDGYLESQSKQAPSDSCEDESSVFTEDSNTTDDSSAKEATKAKKQYSKKNWHEVQPRVPRKRRIASLTAETKVHLLYERDDVEAPKKPAVAKATKARKNSNLLSQGPSAPAVQPVEQNQYTEMTPFTSCKHQVVTQSGTSMPCAECVQLYYSRSLKQAQEQDQPLNLVLNDQVCTCGGTSTLQSGSGCSCQVLSRTTDSGASLTEETNTEVPDGIHSPMSAPVLSATKRPTLVPTSMRRATVDTAECQKLTAFLKNPLMLRMSRHSTDGDSSPGDMPALVNETLEHLTLLQTAGGIIPPLMAPSSLLPQTTTNHLPKSRIPKKILNTANLKPRTPGRRKSTNGWKGHGEPVLKPVVLMNDAVREYRYCYDAIRRKDDEIRTQDCVLLRAGTNRRKEPAYVAKVASLWEEPDSGDLMMTLLWYYQPEHTELGRQPHHLEHELFACRHWDVNSVACIEDRCYVLTPAEYSRYRAKLQRQKEAVNPGRPCVPENPQSYARAYRLPPDDVSPENVFLCRQVYDFRQKRVLKNPS